jgi:hypothetical protein
MLAGAVRVRRRFVDLRAIGVARLSVFVLYLRGRCEGYVFDCRRITYRAKPLCIEQSLSARRDGELVESPAPVKASKQVRKWTVDATRRCYKGMRIILPESRTYCKMLNSFRKFCSAGVAVGASGSLGSWLGMPSSSVAIAKSSRSLRFREDAIDLIPDCLDCSSFRRSASGSSVMSSTTATSVFCQTDGDADLNRATRT